jgi:hypothetical protein
MTGEPAGQFSDAFRWAIEDGADAAMASADWLARDINPECDGACQLLSDERVTLHQLREAKSAFKTLRIVGETSADRRAGARLYAASIASAIVRYDRRISSQSNRALRRGFAALRDDAKMNRTLRDLGAAALGRLTAKPPPERIPLEPDVPAPDGEEPLLLLAEEE